MAVNVLSVKTSHFNHSYISIYTSVQTSSGTKKCEFCVKTVILESVSAYVVFDVLQNTSRTP